LLANEHREHAALLSVGQGDVGCTSAADADARMESLTALPVLQGQLHEAIKDQDFKRVVELTQQAASAGAGAKISEYGARFLCDGASCLLPRDSASAATVRPNSAEGDDLGSS
jgi:hypothetical protein